LEALQITVVAIREQATVSGVIPLDLPEFFILPRASACSFASAGPESPGASHSAARSGK
jgi:hypothetical protein